MSMALITSVYGAYDPVRPYDESWGFDDAVIVTDDPEIDAPGWRVHVQPSEDRGRIASKPPKTQGWRFSKCDESVWIDGSIEITSPHLRRFAEQHLERADFIVSIHPEGRVDIREEGPVCWDWPKYRDWPMREEIAHYAAQGFPERWGLFATGVLAWRWTDRAKAFGKRWYELQKEWSGHDQISLPYLLWDTGMPFGTWDWHQYHNPFFRIRWDQRPAGQGPAALS